LVTGSTQGVGAAIAAEAAKQGAMRVAICGRSTTAGLRQVAELHALGADARFFAVDLSEPDSPLELMSRVTQWAGDIHGLVNAAGLTTRASARDATLENWEELFALNARAPFFLMKAMILECLRASRPASIVNILSMNAHCGAPELAVYSASKGALVTLTRNLANAHLADRIRVNGINMGWSATPAEHEMQSKTLLKGDDWLAVAEKASPLGRLLQPEEVARLSVYLLSDYSGLQTGTIVDLEQKVLGAP